VPLDDLVEGVTRKERTMRTTHYTPSQPVTAALRIGGAAALALLALISIWAIVGAPQATAPVVAGDASQELPSQSAAALPVLMLPIDRRK
jgi:hypothetical protein